MKSLVRAVSIALSTLLLSSAAAAQANGYPLKPVQIIVPYAAGGPLDLSTRLIASELETALGQPFIVQNQPGASGNLGGANVAKAVPDGYTLLLTADTSLVVNPTLYGSRMTYDPHKQLRAVVATVSYGQMLAVHPSVGTHDLKSFLQYAKKHPVNYASAGNGSPGHLTMEQFNHFTQVSMTHIPYKGTSQAVTDLLGGQVQAAFMITPGVIQYVSQNRLIPLAVSSAERSKLAPTVPTMAELGFPEATSEYAFYLMAPAGTPDAIVDLLNEKVEVALKSPALKAFMEKAGMRPLGESPQMTEKRLDAARIQMTQLIQERGIQAN